jgi:hypothetical protein
MLALCIRVCVYCARAQRVSATVGRSVVTVHQPIVARPTVVTTLQGDYPPTYTQAVAGPPPPLQGFTNPNYKTNP